MRPTSPYPKCIGDPQACSGLQCPKRAFPCINEERRRATAERIKNGTYFRPANSNESITYKDGKFEESLKKMMRMYPGDGGYRSDPPKVRPKGVLRVYNRKCSLRCLVGGWMDFCREKARRTIGEYDIFYLGCSIRMDFKENRKH